MGLTIRDLTDVPEWTLDLLKGHLPFSLPVLRRFQSARRIEGGLPPAAHILLVYNVGDSSASHHPSSPPRPAHFAAAYLDPTCGPETECFLYSTLEDASARNEADLTSNPTASCSLPEAERAVCAEQVLALLRRARKIEVEYSAGVTARGSPSTRKPILGEDSRAPDERSSHRPGFVLIGSLHEAVRQLLVQKGVAVRPTDVPLAGTGWNFYDKWFFRTEDVVATSNYDKGLPGGMNWDVIRDKNDTTLVRKRSEIPRRE